MSNVTTEVVYIIDKSKHVNPYKSNIINLINTSIENKKAETEDVKASLYFFNNIIECDYKAVDLNQLPNLSPKNFKPQGISTLNDSLGIILDSVAQRIIKMSSSDRPKNVEIIIVTAGKEDHNKYYTFDQVKSMIRYRQDYFGWTFSFVNKKDLENTMSTETL